MNPDSRQTHRDFSRPRHDVARIAIASLLATIFTWLPSPEPDQAQATGQQATFISVAAGAFHTLAVTSEGILYSWGSNSKGQLGDGTTVSRELPAPVSDVNFGGLTFSAVAASVESSYALRSDGKVFAWGENNRGQLGDGTLANKSLPTAVDTLLTFTSIDAGGGFAVAITEGGEAYSWGYNIRGQLGDGSITDRTTPTTVSTTLTFSAIAAGSEHVLAIASSGALLSWGGNQNGALGDGTSGSSAATNSPKVISTSQFIDVAAGNGFSMAVAADGSLYSWGLNTFGALGLGDQTNRNVPTKVTTNKTLTNVAAGRFHSVAIASSGEMVATGENGLNQVGDGTSTRRLSLVDVSTQSSGAVQFTQVSSDGSANGNHSFAIGTDGLLYGWGNNAYGQLGNGTTTNVPVPTGLPIYPGPSANLGATSTTPTSALVELTCAGSCGPANNYAFAAILSFNGQVVAAKNSTATSATTNLMFTGLQANNSYTLEVTVTHNGVTSSTATSTLATPKPAATISALTVTDTSATLTVGCTNCGTAPDSFTVSATPVAGGPAITSNTNQISGLSSETTYSFSVVVAFAGTTSDVVLWQSNPVMTLPFVPIISAVSPPAVPLTGGSITVAGSNFTTSTELTLDGATLSFNIVSGTQITFTAPSDTEGSYDLAITNPVGTYTLSNAITYVAGPTLVTNSPVLGTTNGGTIVTLTGTNLITTTQVNVGSTTVSFSVISNSVVRFVTAATSAGVVDVGVVTIGGAATLSSALEFTSSPLIPVVSSITPTSGPNSGGTLITVTGQYFSGSYSDSVSAAINGVSGSSVILIDDSTLTFVSPAGSAGAGLDVSVATGGGLGTLAGAFTYTAPPVPVAVGAAPAVVINTPTITEFSTRKISASGAQVSATGLRLENISVLTLGGVTVTIVSNTATTLTFTTGEMPVGIWDLRLVASNGTLVFQQAIEVIEIQEISAESTGELISFAVTLRFSGNSRVLNDQQESHLQRRLRSDADTIICWGYTTSQDPKSWALAHANARAQAACNLAREGMPGVSSIVRLRYGMPKDLAMRASVQFWKSIS